jgi:redox-sensitive bicupin YhaK (pirin superfamily)
MKFFSRRKVLQGISAISTFVGFGYFFYKKDQTKMNQKIETFDLGFLWPTQQPFLFCAHHDDKFPKGLANLGPEPSLLSGRQMGSDFEVKDGFRMYHGEEVPGFPVHPHRGFETVTIVRKGLVDHADSLGASGRYGDGDVQWMTAGSGVQHSEMFPLTNQTGSNEIDFFQVWLNLPKKNKMCEPHFTMFWAEKIPTVQLHNNKSFVSIIAGEFENAKSLNPPPNSWANDPEGDVCILFMKIAAGEKIELKKTGVDVVRSLYFYKGQDLVINGSTIQAGMGSHLPEEIALTLQAGSQPAEILFLQAKKINEPIVQHGPFVMNSQQEIVQTIEDYQRTQFGGWPWGRHDMVHGANPERFAKYPDGRIEKPKA